MLGYISSTRKKSCRQCVKAKRRCDLSYPCCKRCSAKALDCAYPNAEAYHKAEVVIKATPNLNQPTTTTAPPTTTADSLSLDFGAPMEPAVSGVENSDPISNVAFEDRFQLYLGSHSDSSSNKSRSSSPTTTIRTTLLPEIWAPTYLNPFQVRYLISAFRSFVPVLAKDGHNCFIHSQLYADAQPSAYEDAVSLAALYAAKTRKTIPILNKSINNKIASLVATSHTWTLEEHLAAVQAMIIYQTMRLFDPSLRQQTEAVPHNDLLALWAAHLWKRSFTSPITLSQCHNSWVFYESLRRTVLMSVVLRGGWHCVTHDGICNQVPVLARLPLSMDEELWTEDENIFMTRTPCQRKREVLTTYGEFSQTWTPGQDDPARLSDFHRLLLVACRGKEDPRLFFKEPSTVL
ncbi:hypothetical protein DM02DRAFT_527460 [Periconia macrospinosa]|uniref:Zn(2)-C6 fungal-type domain-containing protein n=1 Tax=Periconia macrospinosa TaxID=97972 RepID=A0A2V1DSB7_9PLEO|nr:hypothetical protein DM02DRAFT_527460 [Periconia macrospinosa]